MGEAEVPPLDGHESMADLLPLIRRVVAARVRDPAQVDDLVQETLARVMAARSRVEGDTLAPYAVATARNLIVSAAQREQRARRNAHLLVDRDGGPPPPEDEAVRRADAAVVDLALSRLPPADREMLVAHEVEGRETGALAADRGSTPGAVAARLSRTRARLRVEYLLAQGDADPPTDRCRSALFALSTADRRRQADLDVTGHLLSCDFCAELSLRLLERRGARTEAGDRVPVSRDADVVAVRRRARECGVHAGFTGTDLTLIATAVSEIARNIVKFARRGEFRFSVVTDSGRTGLLITARDSGPGIPDLAEAMRDGYSTYRGLGLGLPGARRLMDEFDIVSEVGKGTTVTMTKWRS
ncbi:MAG: sigma-70 family RNA polymerase sigma factor [Pseudonocardia sp.]